MTVATDHVELSVPERKLRLLVRLGEGSPQVTGGVGGWEVVGRPLRRPLTVWRGTTDPLRMVLPLLFDGFAEATSGRSVEAEIRTLERMGGLDSGDPEPPTILVEGSLPHDASRTQGRNRWVIEGLEWGDAIRRASDGHRVRQAVTATLLLFTEDDRLERIKRPKKAPKFRYVTARQGDTFEKLAARELKLKRAGMRLARLNKGRSPDTPVKRGTRVRLPSDAALRTWKRELGGRR